MTRNEFMEKLAAALSPLSGSERSRILEYYDEMISDRMEEGMSEAEAVEAMGSIDQILAEAVEATGGIDRILDKTAETVNSIGKALSETMKPTGAIGQILDKTAEAVNNFGQAIGEAASEHNVSDGAQSQSNAAAPIVFREPVQSIITNACSANLYIRCAPLPDGATATVELNLPENLQCSCALNHGRLEIHVQNVRQKAFSLRSLFSSTHSSISITLAESALERAELNASSGNAELAGLSFTDRLSIGTSSGDISLTSVKVGASCSLHTASGNITASDLTGGDEISAETASGDFRARNLGTSTLRFSTSSGDADLQQSKCNRIETGTASGDIRLTDVQCNDLSASSASGDVTLNACSASGNFGLHTISGDVHLNGASARSFDISTTSGDIRGSLTGPAGQYSFRASSRTGDVHVPYTNGDCPVVVKTISGDITLRV